MECGGEGEDEADGGEEEGLGVGPGGEGGGEGGEGETEGGPAFGDAEGEVDVLIGGAEGAGGGQGGGEQGQRAPPGACGEAEAAHRGQGEGEEADVGQRRGPEELAAGGEVQQPDDIADEQEEAAGGQRRGSSEPHPDADRGGADIARPQEVGGREGGEQLGGVGEVEDRRQGRDGGVEPRALMGLTPVGRRSDSADAVVVDARRAKGPPALSSLASILPTASLSASTTSVPQTHQRSGGHVTHRSAERRSAAS